MSVINGASNGDVLRGTSGDDIINGLAGDDTIYGEDGNDELNGGEGADLIYGGAGNDRIDGGEGWGDALYGDDGHDRVTISGMQNGGGLSVHGGAGIDTLVLSSSSSQFFPSITSGFEHLIVTGDRWVTGVSGLSSITVDPLSRVELDNSRNPLATLNMQGGIFVLGVNSTLGGLLGSDANEVFRISTGSAVVGNVNLGGGTDRFGTAFPTIDKETSPFGGTVSGGEGFDDLLLGTADATPFLIEHYQADLSKYVDFEYLSIQTTALPSSPRYVADVTILNAKDYSTLNLGGYGKLSIGSTDLPTASVQIGEGSSLTLQSSARVGPVTVLPANPDIRQGYDSTAVTVNNAGTVVGNVTLGNDDDLYNGRGGSVVGTVYGNAGNDDLRGGAVVDRLEGGQGNDVLSGGAGADVLTGGADGDTFIGSLADFAGDRITDFSAADRIVITDASLSSLVVSRDADKLAFANGSLTLSGLGQAKLLVRAAAEGGVELTLSNVTTKFAYSGDVLVANFAVGAGGWSSQDLYPRHIADVNGDGFSDIVGFGQAGVLVSFGSASGTFTGTELVLANFGHASGWTSDNQFHRELADVNGDGRADIIGFGSSGVFVAFGKADGGFSDALFSIANFGTSQGWATQDGFARTVGDVNGDGKADLIGFGYAGAVVSLGNGDGTFKTAAVAIANFGVAQGWASDNAAHRIVADVNGDGSDDVIAFGPTGTLVALSKGDGTFQTSDLVLLDFGKDQGWSSQNSFARDVADVNGDGRADIVGFGIAGTYVAYGQANGTFTPVRLDVLNFGANQGWTSDNSYHRELADINNDGAIDIVGFGQAGVLAGLSQGQWLI